MPAAGPIPAARLSKGEFEEIRQLAYRSFGLDLKPGKEEMVMARLGRLVSAGSFPSFHEYARHVAADASGASLAALIDALATNHTSFLREAEHFEFFQRRVIPDLARCSAPEIWCAACSTGEEAWTLAAIWNEAVPGRSVHIYASDISNKALRRAQAGEYPAEACAALPAAWRARYFERLLPAGGQKAEARFRVGGRLRSQVEFRRINLTAPLPWRQQFPAVFCRNVMIYFDRPTQQNVVRGIAEALEPGGYFFTGHAESLAGISHPLEFVQPAIYRKPGRRAR